MKGYKSIAAKSELVSYSESLSTIFSFPTHHSFLKYERVSDYVQSSNSNSQELKTIIPKKLYIFKNWKLRWKKKNWTKRWGFLPTKPKQSLETPVILIIKNQKQETSMEHSNHYSITIAIAKTPIFPPLPPSSLPPNPTMYKNSMAFFCVAFHRTLCLHHLIVLVSLHLEIKIESV